MADLSFPLDKPLSSLGIKSRLLHLNGMLHAVRKWKDPQADKAIHLLVKDNIGVAGFPTSAGSYALKDLELPDAFCIQRLRRNPNIDFFGKTHLTELAGFVTSNVLPYGYSELGGFGRNPHGNFPCGGSSSGSAIAVAAGFCDAALGTETRGSLMIPGFRNGVFSFKPSRGLVSRTGIIPLSSSFDAPGVLARNPEILREVFLSMIGVDPADDQSFELRSKESKPSRKRIILCVNRSLGEMELLQTKLRSFLAQLKLNGFEIIFIDLPEVSFDYKTISSTDIRADITKFLHRYGPDNEPRSFEGLVECYRERPHAHLYGMERLEDALAMPQIEKSELKKLVQENVAKARNLINSILDRYDADFVGFLNFVDWFSIGGGPSSTLPVSFETKPPISIMLGSRLGNDLALLDIVQEFSEVAKAAQHTDN
ncbi:amidase family protein [Parasutterella excrementihominis]|jgi:amidase|uniref:amidase family protein n=1 Tax=Parasutterella excrementihominis TaxID=487175 RepID=UPI00265FD692|nr:amidase [Parasutterella excrementihominis]